MIRIFQRLKRYMPYGVKAALKAALPETARERYGRADKWAQVEDEGSLENVKALLDAMAATSPKEYLESLLYESTGEVKAFAPGIAVIEINDSCNLDCVMCRTSLAARPKGLMDLGLFESAIEALSGRGARSVDLHTIGDPLSNRNIARYLEILRRHSMKVHRFSTNALMLERHMDTVFAYRDVIEKMRFSIDAASKDVYERIRVGGDWEALHRNLIAFAERNAGAENPFPVSVDNILSKDNFHEIAYIPYVFSYLAPAHNFGFHPISSLAPDANAYFLKASYFDEHLPRRPCIFPWGYMGILKDGRFTTCCRDYDGGLAFGDCVRDAPLEAYNSDFMRGLRRAHLDGDAAAMPDMCQNCLIVDLRIGQVLNAIIHYFYIKVRKHPAYLQGALNRIGPALNRKAYDEAFAIVSSLSMTPMDAVRRS